jgi:hypothetical protein
MSQKANLITIRKKNKIEFVVQNTKLWVSLHHLIVNISRLFFIKGVWVLKSFYGFDTNLVSVNLYLYFQKAKLSLYKRKISKKLTDFNIFFKKKINKAFATLFNKYTKILGLNSVDLNVFNLNKFVNRKRLHLLYKKLKMFSFSIFTRRFNLFIDFLKMNVLFFDNHIPLSSFIKVWSQVFKNLHKRLHGKFFLFVKTAVDSLLKIRLSSKKYKTKHYLSGIKFLLSGRIRGKQRASSLLIKLGNIPTQTISKNIDFSSTHVYTLYGIFGIKIWAYFKI